MHISEKGNSLYFEARTQIASDALDASADKLHRCADKRAARARERGIGCFASPIAIGNSSSGSSGNRRSNNSRVDSQPKGARSNVERDERAHTHLCALMQSPQGNATRRELQPRVRASSRILASRRACIDSTRGHSC